MVNTRFWDDSYIDSLSPEEKLVFLYILTNPLTNIAGVYELSEKRASFDTGLKRDEIKTIFSKFETDKKIIREGTWMGIVNFIRYQSLNPKVCKGILVELQNAPEGLVDRLSIDYGRLTMGKDRLSHSNSNTNINTNPNGRLFKTISTDFPQDIEEGRKRLNRRITA